MHDKPHRLDPAKADMKGGLCSALSPFMSAFVARPVQIAQTPLSSSLGSFVAPNGACHDDRRFQAVIPNDGWLGKPVEDTSFPFAADLGC